MAYAAHRPGQPLWPAVIEKAWAVLRGGELGYQGAGGGFPGATAAMLRPPVTPRGETDVQLTHTIDEPLFQLDLDRLEELLGSSGLARYVLDADSRYAENRFAASAVEGAAGALEKRLRDAIDAVIESMVDEELLPSTLLAPDGVLTEGLGWSENVAGAVTDALAKWNSGVREDAVGSFRAFLTEQWVDRNILLAHMRASESNIELSDTTIARWTAELIEHLLRFQDTVVIGTKSEFAGGNRHTVQLQAGHAYSVVRVVNSGNPETPTAVIVLDPHANAEISVPLKDLNQFSAIGTSAWVLCSRSAPSRSARGALPPRFPYRPLSPHRRTRPANSDGRKPRSSGSGSCGTSKNWPY